MRAFGVASACTSPDEFRGGQGLSRHGIYLAEPDGIVRIAHHIALAVLEVERGVDTALFQPYGL